MPLPLECSSVSGLNIVRALGKQGYGVIGGWNAITLTFEEKSLFYAGARLQHVVCVSSGWDCSQVVVDKLNKGRKASLLRREELIHSVTREDNSTVARMYSSLHHVRVESCGELLS